MEFADVISARYSEDSTLQAVIVSSHLTRAAANLGLGTCWIAAFNIEAARRPSRKPLRELI